MIHHLPLAMALDVALRWLYDTEQPDDAWMSHHGHHIPATDNRYVTVTPTGAENLPVIGINVYKETWTRHPSGDAYPGNPLAPDELHRTIRLLGDRDVAVRATWNGFPAHSGSIGLVRPAHPSQYAAVERYRAGCLQHPNRHVFCECPGFGAGFKRAIRPTALIPAAA